MCIILNHARVCTVMETGIIPGQLFYYSKAIPTWVTSTCINISNILVAEEGNSKLLVMTHPQYALEIVC